MRHGGASMLLLEGEHKASETQKSYIFCAIAAIFWSAVYIGVGWFCFNYDFADHAVISENTTMVNVL